MHLDRVDFTQMVVDSSLMMGPGGTVGPGSYTRTRHNVRISPGLIARNNYVAREVARACSLTDKCLPRTMNTAAIGRPVPGKPGKTFVACTPDEAVRRLTANLGCVTPILSTEGGIYGKA